MRGRAAEIAAEPAVGKHLVDHGGGGAGRAAAGHRVDDAEGVEEDVDDVDDQQEERGRRQQRKGDGPEPPHRAGAVDRAGLEDAFRDRLQAGQKEQEIIGDLLPHRRHHHQRHGVVAVQQRIPVEIHPAQRPRQRAERGMKHEDPEHAGDRGRHRIGPDHQRLVGAGGLQVLVGLGCKQQRNRQRQRRRPATRTPPSSVSPCNIRAGRTASGSFPRTGIVARNASSSRAGVPSLQPRLPA